jgi:hypothetical protein
MNLINPFERTDDELIKNLQWFFFLCFVFVLHGWLQSTPFLSQIQLTCASKLHVTTTLPFSVLEKTFSEGVVK